MREFDRHGLATLQRQMSPQDLKQCFIVRFRALRDVKFLWSSVDPGVSAVAGVMSSDLKNGSLAG